MSLTVACVWVKANVPYSAEYVTKLHGMVRRHLARPFRFVCLTDRPAALPVWVDVITIEPHRGLFGWWSKIELFNQAHHFSGRMLYLDLDVLVVGDLDMIVDYPAEFALLPHAGTFNGKDGLAVVKRFNSSVMVWDAGTQNHVYDTWTPGVADILWGDQDHIGLQCPQAAIMPARWFPRLSDFRWPDVPVDAKVLLTKKPKNTVAAKTMPGFAEAWG
jgi:hypothetical protein